MTLTRYVEVLRARWRLALLVIGAAVALAALLSAIMPRQYRASAAVLIDMRSPDPVANAAVAAAMGTAIGAGYMSTQSDVLQSERVTRQVIRTLKLDQDAALRARWQDATEGRGSFEVWLVEQLQRKLEIQPTRESGVMSISFTSHDPQVAADVANAYVRSYIETTLALRVEPAKRYNDLFDGRAKQLRDALTAAQAKLSAYQQANGIVATDERMDVETARLSELSTQLSAWQAASADARSRLQAGIGAATPLEAAADPVIVGLNGELARQQLKVSDLRERLGESHPQLLEAAAGVNQLRAQIAAETRRLTAGMAATGQINQSREAQLRAMLDEQRLKVLRLKRQRDDAGVLLRDVENARAAYDAMQARAGQSGLESANTQTNVSVLQEATPPAMATFPKPVANIAVALVLGTLLAMAVVLMREMSDRRIRTIDDVVVELNQKLLVVMPRGAARDSAVGLAKARILGRSLRPASQT